MKHKVASMQVRVVRKWFRTVVEARTTPTGSWETMGVLWGTDRVMIVNRDVFVDVNMTEE